MSVKSHAAEVDHAARYFDVEHPGWFERIDTSMLDLSSCLECVIGQVLAPSREQYSWAEEVDAIIAPCGLSEDDKNLAARGFTPHVFSINEYYRVHWIREIKRRRKGFRVPRMPERTTSEDCAEILSSVRA